MNTRLRRFVEKKIDFTNNYQVCLVTIKSTTHHNIHSDRERCKVSGVDEGTGSQTERNCIVVVIFILIIIPGEESERRTRYFEQTGIFTCEETDESG